MAFARVSIVRTVTRFATALDGARIAYEEVGRGEPVLLHSGANYDRRTWSGIRDDLAAEHRVIVFDQRGTGESDRDIGLEYDRRTMARDIIAILDACGADRAHVGGLSRGGRFALQAAVDHPQRIATLLLVSTSPGGSEDSAVPPGATQRPLPERMYSAEWIAQHPEQEPEMREVHALTTPAVRAKRDTENKWDLWPVLGEVRAPVLIVHGTEDDVCAPENASRMAERLRSATVEMIPGGRHGMHREFRPAVARAMLKFLRAHPLT